MWDSNLVFLRVFSDTDRLKTVDWLKMLKAKSLILTRWHFCAIIVKYCRFESFSSFERTGFAAEKRSCEWFEMFGAKA